MRQEEQNMIRIAVASGKGGTGKTFISTNIFNALVQANKPAVLTDCDAEAPDAALFFTTKQDSSYNVTQIIPEINTDTCIYCGKCHEYCNYNAIFLLPGIKFIRVIEELCHGCGACFFACEYGAISEKEVILGKVSKFRVNGRHLLTEARMNAGVMTPVPIIKSALKSVNNSGSILLLDSPPGTSCPFIHTIAGADYVILVTEPTPYGFSDLKQCVEILRQMEKPFGIIVNRAGSGDSKVYEWIDQNNYNLLMEIPLDKDIARTYSEGRLLTDEVQEYRSRFLLLINKIKKQINEI